MKYKNIPKSVLNFKDIEKYIINNVSGPCHVFSSKMTKEERSKKFNKMVYGENTEYYQNFINEMSREEFNKHIKENYTLLKSSDFNKMTKEEAIDYILKFLDGF